MLISAPCARIFSFRFTSSFDEPPRNTPFVLTKKAPLLVLEAMKMEQPLTAHKDGTVTGLAVEIGQTVSAGTTICRLAD